MVKKINTFFNTSIFVSMVCLLLGVLCIFNPSISFQVIRWILVIMFFLNGGFLLFSFLKYSSIFFERFILGMLSLILGMILCFFPNVLEVFIPFAVGLWFLLSGLESTYFAVCLKEESFLWMVVCITLSLISSGLGVFLICKPTLGTSIVVMSFGIVLVIHAISNILDIVFMKQYMNQIVKRIETSITNFLKL